MVAQATVIDGKREILTGWKSFRVCIFIFCLGTHRILWDLH